MIDKTLLIIAHTPSVNTQILADRLSEQMNNQGQESQYNFRIVQKSPQDTMAEDVLSADGVILGTTENLAYMAGLTKDFFDRCYYDLLEQKQGMPYAIYIRAVHDGTGTRRALESINNGLKWQMIQAPLILHGKWNEDFIQQVNELGMAMVVGMDMGIF